jgi:uncharacterized LabA/DUF88 family protein
MQLLPKPQKSKSDVHSLSLEGPDESPRLSLIQNFSPFRENYPFGDENPVSNERVVILIDGASLFYSASQLGIEIDYAKLLCCLTQQRRLVRAYFYTGVDSTNEKQQRFLLWMRRHGYRVVTKDLITHTDGSQKANLEVEMAIDMMTLAQYCDRIILLTGNGDLSYAVDKIAYQGIQVEIVGLASMTSNHLIDLADRFIDLTMLQDSIKKE